MRDLAKPQRGFRCDSQIVFIRMLSKSANGAEYRDADDIDGLGSKGNKQRAYIWQTLIDNGALRRTPSGRFSLYAWMIERNLLAYDARTRNRRNYRKTTTTPTTSNANEPPTQHPAPFVPPQNALIGKERDEYIERLRQILQNKNRGQA